jgi:hypothetical protein
MSRKRIQAVDASNGGLQAASGQRLIALVEALARRQARIDFARLSAAPSTDEANAKEAGSNLRSIFDRLAE